MRSIQWISPKFRAIACTSITTWSAAGTGSATSPKRRFVGASGVIDNGAHFWANLVHPDYSGVDRAFTVSTWCRPTVGGPIDMPGTMASWTVIANPGCVHPAWRDPLSAGWRAHRNLLMLRLRWHERGRADRRPDRR